jgi:hypothetical protein
MMNCHTAGSGMVLALIVVVVAGDRRFPASNLGTLRCGVAPPCISLDTPFRGVSNNGQTTEAIDSFRERLMALGCAMWFTE